MKRPIVAARYLRTMWASLRARRELARARTAIVSYPKSGRTWLRVLIARALAERYGLGEDLILEGAELARAAGLPPFLYTHDGAANTEGRHWRRLDRDKSKYAEKRVLLLVRDPRDVVVSCFFQATHRKSLFEGSIAQFIRDDRFGVRKIVEFHRAWAAAMDTPAELLLMRYEDLQLDTARGLRDALRLLGVHDVGDEIIANAVNFASFSNMKRLEHSGYFRSKRLRPDKADDEESSKTRRGKVGGYVDYLDEAERAYVDEVIASARCPFYGPGATPPAPARPPR